MRQQVVIVTGISGVGKTWLLERVAQMLPAQVLSAGRLIAEEQSLQTDLQVPYDDLRARDIDANQKVLAKAFKRRLDIDASIVLLDAHILVDTPLGLKFIACGVFVDIRPTMFLFIEDEPEQIQRYRSEDPSRCRPTRDAKALAMQQEQAKSSAKDIATELCVPFHVLKAGDVEGVVQLLQERAGDVHV